MGKKYKNRSFKNWANNLNVHHKENSETDRGRASAPQHVHSVHGQVSPQPPLWDIAEDSCSPGCLYSQVQPMVRARKDWATQHTASAGDGA